MCRSCQPARRRPVARPRRTVRAVRVSFGRACPGFGSAVVDRGAERLRARDVGVRIARLVPPGMRRAGGGGGSSRSSRPRRGRFCRCSAGTAPAGGVRRPAPRAAGGGRRRSECGSSWWSTASTPPGSSTRPSGRRPSPARSRPASPPATGASPRPSATDPGDRSRLVGPERAAAAVHRALLADRPRARYRVGRDARLRAVLPPGPPAARRPGGRRRPAGRHPDPPGRRPTLMRLLGRLNWWLPPAGRRRSRRPAAAGSLPNQLPTATARPLEAAAAPFTPRPEPPRDRHPPRPRRAARRGDPRRRPRPRRRSRRAEQRPAARQQARKRYRGRWSRCRVRPWSGPPEPCRGVRPGGGSSPGTRGAGPRCQGPRRRGSSAGPGRRSPAPRCSRRCTG